VRRIVASGLVAALQLGALQSGFVHAHTDGHDTPHHHGRLVHAHLSDHLHLAAPPGHRLAIHDDDADHTLTLQLFLAVAAATFHAPALPEHSFAVNQELTAAVRRQPVVLHSHDPPDTTSLAPRAPPAAVLI
jgi:hypothetical protein